MAERFVGERLQPAVETADTSRLALGEPGLPERFSWRGGTIVVARVLRVWRETGPCTHGSGERYVRKHWFEVEAANGEVVKLYFERRGRRGEGRGSRWWLFSVRPGDAPSR